MTPGLTQQIFIGGCDRSGTTLLGAMLGAGQDAICVPESQFITEVMASFGDNLSDIDGLVALEMIKNHWRFKLWELDLTDLIREAMGQHWSYPQLLSELVLSYAAKAGRPSARFWVDHTPANVRYAATLFDLFPQAKFVHLVRDGRAVAASMMPLDWGPNTIIAAAHWWVEMVAYGLAVESRWGPAGAVRVYYEDLVSRPEQTLQTLCARLEVEYQPEMLAANGFRVPRYTQNQHQYIGRKPNPERINAWQKDLTARQIEIFENITHDMLRYLGYDLKYGWRASPPSTNEKVIQLIQETFQKFQNSILFRRRRDSAG